MEKLTNEEFIKKVTKAMLHLSANTRINEYAKEQLILGLKKEGDRVTVSEFAKATGYDGTASFDVGGAVLDEYGIIREGIKEKCVLEFFNYQMSCIFQDSPMKNRILDFDDDGLMTFADDTGEYIKSCFPLFEQVLNTKVDCDPFDLIIPHSRQFISEGRKKCVAFLEAIKLKKLKVGANVSKYFKNVVYIPYFVNELVEKDNKKYVLKCNDINDMRYKFALFTLLDFKSTENVALIEFKCKAVAGV